MLFSRRFNFLKAAEAYVTNNGSNNARDVRNIAVAVSHQLMDFAR